MRKKAKLNFGEKMREWRKAKKEFSEKVKQKLKEKQDIEEQHPTVKPTSEPKTLNLTEMTEIKPNDVSSNSNPIEMAISRLREKAKGV